MSGYVQRKIDLSFVLGEGSFGDDGSNTVKVTGLRVSAAIDKSGLPGYHAAQVRVNGLPLSLMNKLSTLGKPPIYERMNTIAIAAGDTVNGMSQAFSGIIGSAWSDFNGAPDVSFNVTAFFGKLDAMRPVPALSYPGPADAAVILSGIASQLGYAFENNGVSVMLQSSYFPGTAREQAIAVAKHANIDIDMDNNTIAIWPKNTNRGGQIPLISPQTGMIGYPNYSGTSIVVRSLYNPSISFGSGGIGRQMQVESSITPACGNWIITRVNHTLESETPDGQWMTEVQGYRLGAEPTIPR